MVEAALARHRRYIDPEVVQRSMKITDFAVLFAGAVALHLQAALLMDGSGAITMAFLAMVMVFATLIGLRSLKVYDIAMLPRPLRTVGLATGFTWLAGAAMFAVARSHLFAVDGQWLIGWMALSALHFAISRSAVAKWARPLVADGAFRQRIAIVGGGKAAAQAIEALETSAGLDVEIVGLFDDRDDQRSPAAVGGHRKIGRIGELAGFARAERVDLVIVAIPLAAEQRLLQVLRRLWELPLDIRISGQSTPLKFSPRAYAYLGKLPLLSVFDRPLAGWDWVLKSAMDRALAALLLVLLWPVMALVALAIRLDSPGPVLFRQKRYGFNNELVEVLKFRSMHVAAADADASRLVTRGDARVTRVGRFIRRTSLDELPQLINVLTGDLSLVGPRPHATQAKAAGTLYEQVVDGYFARHKVKPGITGWAQINGWRGETDTSDKIENRVKFDLEYIDQWSLYQDLKILLKTPFALVCGRNAY